MRIKTVLFAIGGVLAPDYWETLWLTQTISLADFLDVAPDVAFSAGLALWPRYSVRESSHLVSEDDFWADFAEGVQGSFRAMRSCGSRLF